MRSDNHREHQTQMIVLSSTAQRPLLAMALVCMVLVGFGSVRNAAPSPRPEVNEPAVARALDFFLANRLSEALQALDPETFERSGKANFLSGLIHLYRPREDREKARAHLERAGTLGIGHAYTILGHLTLDDGCAGCQAQAAVWYERALERREDPDAQLGRAIVLNALGDRRSALAEFDRLLAATTPLYVRVWAAAFAAGLLLEQNPSRAKALLRFAALQGHAEAQAMLGLLFLREGQDVEAETWLAHAVGQRAELAMEWYWAQSVEKQLEVLHRS